MAKDWPDPAVVDAAVARARAAVDRLGGFESAEVIRSQRDERGPRDPSSELRSVIRDTDVDLDLPNG